MHEPAARPAAHTVPGGCPSQAKRISVRFFPNLAREWHPTKNGSLTPAEVLPGSHLHVWWRCANGHEWMAQIKSRVSGCGCPLCAHKTVQPGKTDLATVNPMVAAQWHPTKNGALTPRDVLPGTSRRVWWLCEKGHSWQATVSSRALGGSECPYCTGRKVQPGENDLATAFPEIAAQWHPTKNGSLTPQQVTPNSNRKVWWICPLGHEYQSWIPGRTRQGSGCPYCAGTKVLPGFNDLATRGPQIAAQWHPHLQRRADAVHGHARVPPQGLVAMQRGARLEGRCPLPRRSAKMRLPRLRRGHAATPKHQGDQAHIGSSLTACAQQEPL